MTVIRFPSQPALTPLADRLSAEVRALKGRFGVNQTQIGEWLGLAQSAVSARLHGDTEWKVSEVEILARHFGVHPAELLGGFAEDPRPDGGPGIPMARRKKLPRLDSNQEPTDLPFALVAA